MEPVTDVGLGPLFGPSFSTFRPDEVGWLVDDYSDLALERDTAQREFDIQAGRSHYADDLPRETAPTAEYLGLFDAALGRNALVVANAVAFAADQLFAEARGHITLVSLARAGVPAGIWLKARLESSHDITVDHFAISIVRGRGLDLRALAWVARHCDPAGVVFVDGWTGKGAIRRELSQGLRDARRAGLDFPDRFLVIADPARVADIAGTFEDLLIPTACLNSTSCGLVSRTVLPRPGYASGYHGAKQYREYRSLDRSRVSIDVVIQYMSSLIHPVRAPLRTVPDATSAVRHVALHLGISNLNLIKPGIGETTRVLQRRVPWKVLAHPDHIEHPDLAHVRALAEFRGVNVVPADTGPYRCIGVVKPVDPECGVAS